MLASTGIQILYPKLITSGKNPFAYTVANTFFGAVKDFSKCLKMCYCRNTNPDGSQEFSEKCSRRNLNSKGRCKTQNASS